MYAFSSVWITCIDVEKMNGYVTYSVAFTSVQPSLAWHASVARNTCFVLKSSVNRFCIMYSLLGENLPGGPGGPITCDKEDLSIDLK